MITASTSEKPDAPPERFSWYDVPPQSKREIRRQHFRRDLLDRGDRLARAESGRRLADDLHRRQVVEAVERVGTRRVPDRGERGQRDHLAFRRAHVDAADVVGPLAIRRIGRHQHLPRPAVLVEVVDVVGAERAGERVVDVVDRHAELLRLVAVGVDVELRHGRAPQRLRAAQLLVAVRAREKRLRDFGEPLGAAFAAVLDVELEPARRAEAEDRRRVEREHQRFLDAHRPAEELADEARRGHLALVPRHLDDEERRRAVAEAAADEVEARERDDVLVRRIGADRFLDLLHDLVRALERRAVGQEHRADVEALVLVGDEASRRGLPQPGGDRHHADEQHDARRIRAGSSRARRRNNGA